MLNWLFAILVFGLGFNIGGIAGITHGFRRGKSLRLVDSEDRG